MCFFFKMLFSWRCSACKNEQQIDLGAPFIESSQKALSRICGHYSIRYMDSDEEKNMFLCAICIDEHNYVDFKLLPTMRNKNKKKFVDIK